MFMILERTMVQYCPVLMYQYLGLKGIFSDSNSIFL